MSFYQEFVTRAMEEINLAISDRLFKYLMDLAKLLDASEFMVTAETSAGDSLVEVRERAYNRFCSACQMAGLPLPNLEDGLIDCHLSEKDGKDSARSQATPVF